MTEMFGEAWSPMSVPDLAPDDDDDDSICLGLQTFLLWRKQLALLPSSLTMSNPLVSLLCHVFG